MGEMDNDGFTVVKKAAKSKPVKHLVLDTGAIIANVNLHHIADSYYAPPEVLAELKSKKAIAVFEKLPFEVVVREPTVLAMKTVIDASKKTGDYQSLSVPDMKVIALTYDLAQQMTKKEESDKKDATDADVSDVAAAVKEKLVLSDSNAKSDVASLNQDGSGSGDKKEEGGRLPEGFCEDAESDDEDGWITEDNIANALKKMGAFEVEEGMTVGCLTTDFALQNVLLSMHLGLVSLTGYRIKKLKSFLLRCRACYSTTTNMEKEFCPKCGNKMLHKCAVSVDENGEQVLHINWDRLQNKRGLKHSLAAPKGGKHAMNERLFEDQRMPQNRMAKVRADPLGDGPFSMHDTTSRSALLGVRTMSHKQSNRRNPNESRGSRKK